MTSINQRPLLAGVLLVSAVAISWWALSRGPDEQELAPEPAVAEQAIDAPAAWTAPPRRVMVPGYAGLPLPEKQEYDAAGKSRDVMAKNEAAWSKDPTAPEKSAQIEEKFRVATASDGVTSAHFQPESVSVQCRSGMCRIESVFPPGASGGEWAVRMQLALGGTTIGNVVTVSESLPNSGEKLLMYAYMPGHPPPA
ncbi:MAG: hypothetical protein ABIP44_11035 [Pseudoxanthomonas sp.]